MRQSEAIEILNETYRRCQNVFPGGIQDAYLYGSYARDDFDSGSDVDILLTVDILPTELSAYRNRIAAVSSELSLAHDITVSIAVKPLEQFRRYSEVLPYYQNVLRESIRCAVG